jgi:cytochrome oxidase Cu insertion factor (SCO1/SenC/PrrC family)
MIGLMGRRLSLVWPLLLAAMASVLAGCQGEEGSGGAGVDHVTVGDRAPAFDLPSVDGERVSLDDYTGRKPVLLYFSMGPG